MDLEKFNKFLDYLRRGHMRADALALAGIDTDTFRGWVAQAKNGVEPFTTTVRLADIAESEAVDRYLVKVDQLALKGNLKAAEFMLKSLRPERFREKPVEVNVSQQQAVQLTTMEAKEKVYTYAIELFKKEPLYLDRLRKDLLLEARSENDPHLGMGREVEVVLLGSDQGSGEHE